MAALQTKSVYNNLVDLIGFVAIFSDKYAPLLATFLPCLEVYLLSGKTRLWMSCRPSAGLWCVYSHPGTPWCSCRSDEMAGDGTNDVTRRPLGNLWLKREPSDISVCTRRRSGNLWLDKEPMTPRDDRSGTCGSRGTSVTSPYIYHTTAL